MKKYSDTETKGKKRTLVFIVLTIVAILLIISGTYLYTSDAFEKEPEMEVTANNCYSETIRVVTDKDYYPFSYIDEKGEYAGLDVELINEIANRLEVNLDLELMDWSEANRELKEGEADAILNMELNRVTKESGLIATIPTAEKQYVVYGREAVSSYSDLYGKRIASMQMFPELGLTREIIHMDSYEEMFKALEKGEFDFVLCPIQVGNMFLERLEIKDITHSYAVSHMYGCIALRAKGDRLRTRMNTAIRDMAMEGRLVALDEKWVRRRYENMSLAGFLSKYPAIPIVFLIIILYAVGQLVYLVMNRRRTKERDKYLKELQERSDIIDHKNQELTEAVHKAEAGRRAKDTFLFNVSHDFRTPMNAIIGFTELGVKSQNMGESQNYFRKIKNAGDQLLTLVNDVLEMSRIENSELKWEDKPCEINNVLNGIRDLFDLEMEKKKIHFSVSAEEVKHSMVLCDENHMNRILLNLVSNAYKFTEENGSVQVIMSEESWNEYCASGESCKVYSIKEKNFPGYTQGTSGTGDNSDQKDDKRNAGEDSGKRDNKRNAGDGSDQKGNKSNAGDGSDQEDDKRNASIYTLRVKDNGIGMSEEFAQRLFQAFERERTSTETGLQGAGLGMAITKRLVDDMGGTIEVETEKGKGTEFIVRLPLRYLEKQAEQGSQETPDSGEPAAENTSEELPTRFDGKRALLVDDNEINREIANMLLSEYGFSVDEAADGQEAVDCVNQKEAGYYDVVLMDIQMPVMNGYDATRAICALPDQGKAKVPIIAMTANTLEENRKEAYDSGMCGFVPKPIDVDEMFRVLRETLYGGS
ncbi:MAG: transporter substrate-binding domain-containing protein [Lachnospiraceae bacterium]|nr:transporter substrate-binding domain-containing protein [Lachnospiraceae bacterium]